LLISGAPSAGRSISNSSPVSFVDNIRVQAGDEFEIDLPALGAPLINKLLIEPGGLALHETAAL